MARHQSKCIANVRVRKAMIDDTNFLMREDCDEDIFMHSVRAFSGRRIMIGKEKENER